MARAEFELRSGGIGFVVAPGYEPDGGAQAILKSWRRSRLGTPHPGYYQVPLITNKRVDYAMVEGLSVLSA